MNRIAVRNAGIIAQRCLYWWRFLPVSVRSYYDAEDMISDVTLHVMQKAYHFNNERAQESTFVWWTAEHKCNEIVTEYFQRKKRTCELVELSPKIANQFSGREAERYRLSLDAVERVIEYGSDAVLELIECLL